MRYKLDKPVVSTLGETRYKCDVEWRNGSFAVDEPLSLGGGDTGPDPFSLLLASLASCKIVTVRMFAEKQGWHIPSIRVAANLFETRKEQQRSTTIDCDLSFPGADLSQEQRERLQKVAQNCPVSHIIKGDSQVRTFVLHRGDDIRGKRYSNETISVEWKPNLCQHAGRCVGQLPKVFKPGATPWINIEGAPADRLAEQVSRCPTGALSLRQPD